DALGIERRELPLHLARDGEVEVGEVAARPMAQDRACLARVVVAVVAEEYDAPAELGLQPPRRPDLGDEEAAREEPTRLLPERDDGGVAHAARPSAAPGGDGSTACSRRLNATHATQPMRLYQR